MWSNDRHKLEKLNNRWVIKINILFELLKDNIIEELTLKIWNKNNNNVLKKIIGNVIPKDIYNRSTNSAAFCAQQWMFLPPP